MKLNKTTDCMSGNAIYSVKGTDLTIYELSGVNKTYELWAGDSKYKDEPYNTLCEAVKDMKRIYGIITQ